MWYLIPGLGADERVFRRLRLPGPRQVLSWLKPESPTEPLVHYAARLAEAVPADEPCWLVGVSFGGLLAQEIGRLRPLARVVPISSLSSPRDLPPLLRLAGTTGLRRLLPFGLLKGLPRLAQWFFGARDSTEYRLLRQILRDTDPNFARWATQLLAWRGPGLPGAVPARHPRPLATPRRSPYRLPGTRRGIVSHAAWVSQVLQELTASEASAKA